MRHCAVSDFLSKELPLNTGKPLASELPKPTILWSGETEYLGNKVPCRVVYYFLWQKDANDNDWRMEPQVGFEVSQCTDLMGGPHFSLQPLNQLPVSFFSSILLSKSLDKIETSS